MGSCAVPRTRLGLNLTRTSSTVKSVESLLLREKKIEFSMGEISRIEDGSSKPVSNKVKASNFPATTIEIGDWKWETLNSGDLIAKIYYAKRRLVWEFLHGPLKTKIEIKWSDISAIKATLDDMGRGILQIELNQPPSFFGETEPQPRKHTNWTESYDFTGGQALRWRIHSLVFPPKTLDKHYTQLLQCDERLLALSQRPFPSQEYPYFDPVVLQESHNLNGQGTRFPPEEQDLTYPTIGGDFPVELSQVSTVSSVVNHQYPTQGHTSWNLGTNFTWGNDNMQGRQYISSVTSSNHIIPYQNHQSSAGLFDDIQNNFVGDFEIAYANKWTLYESTESLPGLMNLSPQNGANYLATTHQMAYDGRGMQSADNTYSQEIEQWNDINWMSPQESVQDGGHK